MERRLLGLSHFGALAALAAMDTPQCFDLAQEVIRPRRRAKSPPPFAPELSRDERRAGRKSKKHRLKGLRP